MPKFKPSTSILPKHSHSQASEMLNRKVLPLFCKSEVKGRICLLISWEQNVPWWLLSQLPNTSSYASTAYLNDGISVECVSVFENFVWHGGECLELTGYCISIWLKSPPSQVILTLQEHPPFPQTPLLLNHPYHFVHNNMPFFPQRPSGAPLPALTPQAWSVFPPDAASARQAADSQSTCSQKSLSTYGGRLGGEYLEDPTYLYAHVNILVKEIYSTVQVQYIDPMSFPPELC